MEEWNKRKGNSNTGLLKCPKHVVLAGVVCFGNKEDCSDKLRYTALASSSWQQSRGVAGV